MKLIIFLIFYSNISFASGSSVGTLNQVTPDPAQKEFENEYDDLQKTINDLDKPKVKARSSLEREEKRESKLPSNEVETDYKKKKLKTK